jgi:hypothetical protein
MSSFNSGWIAMDDAIKEIAEEIEYRKNRKFFFDAISLSKTGLLRDIKPKDTVFINGVLVKKGE